MRFLLLSIILISSFYLKGQKDTSFLLDTNRIQFKLKVDLVKDAETKEILGNVNLRIDGTDGSSREYKSDSSGLFPIIDLDTNTSYSLIVSKNRYLTAKGKETTVGLIKSRIFIHEYNMQYNPGCGGRFMPFLYYSYNSLEPFSNEEDSDLASIYYQILTDNPSIVFQIQGFRDRSEKKNISKQRAESYKAILVKMGINKKRLVAIDGGVIDKEDSKENRTISLKVLSTDFEPK